MALSKRSPEFVGPAGLKRRMRSGDFAAVGSGVGEVPPLDAPDPKAGHQMRHGATGDPMSSLVELLGDPPGPIDLVVALADRRISSLATSSLTPRADGGRALAA